MANKTAIDASWNSFDSVKEAKAYFDEHMLVRASARPNVEYGIEVVSTDYWKINIIK